MAGQFSVELERSEPVVVMIAKGEVDASTVGQLDSLFETAVTEHETHVVVDANGITFIDSTGISALVAGMRRLNRSRRRLALACSTEGAVGRALAVTGLDHTFECHESADDAVAALSDAPMIGR
jgi:anti-sigma B factor antagonist